MDENNTLVLGIDLGTHGSRVLCVDRHGIVHGKGSFPHQRISASGGTQEQPLDEVWSGMKKAIHQATSQVIKGDNLIGGMAVTQQRGTLVAFDKSGMPIGNAICDSDNRSWPQAEYIARTIGSKKLFRATGCPAVAFNGLTKIVWLLQEHPEFVSKVAKWGSIQDWAVFRLSGEMVSSPGSALRLGVVNIQDSVSYADDILVKLGIHSTQMIPMQPMGSKLGCLKTDVAVELGLPSGIPIYPAPGDQPAAVIGSGAVHGLNAAVNLGTSFLTSFPINRIEDVRETAARANCTLEILPDGMYALELGSGAGTNVLDWMRNTLFQLESVEELNQLMETSEKGAKGVLVSPSWWSALGGRKGSIRGIDSNHTRGDLVQATYEGLAFDVLWAWNQLSRYTNTLPEQVALFGGASLNSTLCQLLADVFNRPTYQTKISEASAFGAAICAASGLGWFESVLQAANIMTRITRVFEPQRDYQSAYQRYLSFRVDL